MRRIDSRWPSSSGELILPRCPVANLSSILQVRLIMAGPSSASVSLNTAAPSDLKAPWQTPNISRSLKKGSRHGLSGGRDLVRSGWVDLRERTSKANLHGGGPQRGEPQRGEPPRCGPRGATLREANLREANLRGADLRRADLFAGRTSARRTSRGGPPRGGPPRGEPPRGADLRGADLRGRTSAGRISARRIWSKRTSKKQISRLVPCMEYPPGA